MRFVAQPFQRIFAKLSSTNQRQFSFTPTTIATMSEAANKFTITYSKN